MDPTFDERLDAIAWGEFGTAYGPAVAVPDQLRRLASSDPQAALDASHDLWCGLCHQHVQVGSAALPALPFLLEVLDRADRQLTIEILDILLGFAHGVNRRRVVEFQHRCGRSEIEPESHWSADLRTALRAELPRFHRAAESPDAEIAGFARQIVAELTDESAS